MKYLVGKKAALVDIPGLFWQYRKQRCKKDWYYRWAKIFFDHLVLRMNHGAPLIYYFILNIDFKHNI